MKEIWTKKWKKALIWFSAYFSFIAFSLVGGYIILKDDDEELKRESRLAFFVTLIFAAISAFLSIFSNFAGMFDDYYYSALYDVHDVLSRLTAIAKIVVFAVFILMAFFKKNELESEEDDDDEDD